MSQKVVSREYKVMLKKECFVGLQTDLLERAGHFWNAVKASIQDIAVDTDGSLNTVDKQRAVRFYDSADHRLRKNSYVFRERVAVGTGKRKVTLKFRHPDRYISQDRNMPVDKKKGQPKFEEDIKLPFQKLYSFSSKQKISRSKSLNTMGDPGELYPDLKMQLKSYQETEPIGIVRDFTAREIVITGASFKIRETPEVEVECALIIWYDESEDNKDEPVVVEFSFRYGDKKEHYDAEAAQRAYEIFCNLKEMLAEWIDATGPTKTAYVYSRANQITRNDVIPGRN